MTCPLQAGIEQKHDKMAAIVELLVVVAAILADSLVETILGDSRS